MKMYPRTFSGQPSVQVEEELTSFIDLLREHEVSSYLEVGCGNGDTFHEIVSHLPAGALAVAVDLPGAGWSLKNSAWYLTKAVEDLKRSGYNAHMILGDSTNMQIVNKAAALGGYDALFIDGDHTLRGVTQDALNYGPLTKKLVGFHDIADPMRTNMRGETIEVPLFWETIKAAGNKTREFISEGSTMGIGVYLV